MSRKSHLNHSKKNILSELIKTESCHEQYIREALNYARGKNPIWPFAALIVNQEGKILVKATDCAHISPLFHAETLAIHAAFVKLRIKEQGHLTLYTTIECDVLSQAGIYWANIQGLPIKEVVYGVSFEGVKKLWPFGIDISAAEIVSRSIGPKVKLVGPILEAECLMVFQEAKKRQLEIGKPHPARETLSNSFEDFFDVLV